MEKELPPFLKWPGGKRWLTSKYLKLLPKKFNHYYEPFLGGGAVFFAVCPESATLSDVNTELINLYQVMRDNHIELIDAMKEHQNNHTKEYYYQIRSREYSDKILAASRFLYLNRTCFNGMYRVNKAGKFNVPIGTKNDCIFDIDKFQTYSSLLQNAGLIISDFEGVISNSAIGDLVFADPPYTIAHNQNSFIKYNEHLFSWDDQERLHKALCGAKERGVNIISTNANFEKLRKLYQDSGFFIKILERYCSISGKADKRSKQEELLVSSLPLNENLTEVCNL